MSRYTGGGGFLQLNWWLTNVAIDLDFANGRYYDASLGTPTSAVVTDYLSCTRASNGYADTSANTISLFSSNTLRITSSGLRFDDARTNLVLWNRDLTNAAWTKTNMTAALDQTGPDGSSNAASSLLATAGNATVLQSITDASTARFQSAWVKRLIGSGTINMTMDNGTTWTAITVTSAWSRLSIPTQTLANPIVGFRIVTSGDKIAVDFVQNEAGAFISSEIATTTASATRAADAISCINLMNSIALGSNVSIYALMGAGIQMISAGHDVTVFHLGSTISRPFHTGDAGSDASRNHITCYEGTWNAVATFGSGTWIDGIDDKIAAGWDSGGRSIVANGGSVASNASTFTSFGSNAGLGGQSVIGQANPYVYFRRFAIFNTRLADVTLQGLTV